MTFWPDIHCKGRKIGYARVSTKDQKLRMQLDGLNAVGCSPIFKDHGISGADANRPGLDEMLKAVEAGRYRSGFQARPFGPLRSQSR